MKLDQGASGRVDPIAELGERSHAARVRARTEPRALPEKPHEILLEQLLELQVVSTLLDELVQVDSGESIAVPRLYVLNANNPFEIFNVEATSEFHSVKVDNFTGVPIEIGFNGARPVAAASDERIPPLTGRILTRPYNSVAIGVDPALLPATDVVVRVTFYSRPLPPISYGLGGQRTAIETILGADPAAGVEITQIVPAGEVWELCSVNFDLVTSAVVANRRVVLTIDDGLGNIILRTNTGADHTAGLTVHYSFANVGARANDLAQGESLGMLPPNLVLQSGWRIRTSTLLKDAGDNFSAPVFAVKRR